MEGAAAVDKALAPFLGTCSWAQVDRAVDAARAAHDPDEAERLRLAAAEHRHATVYLDGAGTTGTVDVIACIDAADALDLEAALRDGAQTLAPSGRPRPSTYAGPRPWVRWPVTSRPWTSRCRSG